MKLRLPCVWVLARALAAPLVASAALAAVAGDVRAEDPATAQREAGRHFERAVALYGEADYQGALVEFKRAYAIAPNPTVLYNIGQAQFQLQDYAAALTSFTRFLGEAPAGAAHRGEVETNLDLLRGRVGHLGVVTVPPGADVSIDDQPAGKTPLPDRVLVSVGHRKVTASLPGRPLATRFVDVAADDNASVTLEVPAGGQDAVLLPAFDKGSGEVRSPSSTGATLRTIGWISTGMLALGAGGAGALALKESADLKAARNTFPTSPAVLQDDADRTRTYSILADSLTVAALVVGGITLLSTLASSGGAPRAERAARLRPVGSSVDLEVKF